MAYRQTLPGTQEKDFVTFTIKINGNNLGVEYQVSSIQVINEVNRIPQAKIVIYDGSASKEDFAISNDQLFVPGAKIEIAAGYHSDETNIFKGILLNHSIKIRNDKAPVLVLECRDGAVKMTIARKNKYFYNTTDSSAIQNIIGANGLTGDIKDTSIRLDSIIQFNSTDWDFILTRAEANGMVCISDNGKITAKKPDLSGDAVLDAVFGATILEFDAEIDPRNQYSTLNARTWDFANQQITQVTANDPGLTENGNLSSGSLSAVLSNDYNLHIGEEVTENELQAYADSRMLKARLSRCRGRVSFRGYAPLLPAELINVGGVGERFNGKVFVSGVRHEIINGDWTTNVQFGMRNDLFTSNPEVHAPPAGNLIPSVQGLQVGIVTKLENDPNGQDRIRVRLPIIDAGEDGIWARISSLDAGNKRGWFYRPEIGDEVIVGFLNEDPRFPVVLGMLNSSAKPAPLTASDQNDEKGYVSRSGMRMIFNDKDKSLKIDTPAGKKVTISEADGAMTMEDENGNKITMDASSSITIQSASNMNLKAGGDLNIDAVNINLTASANFSLSASGSSLNAGSGSASLSAPTISIDGSATTNVKGGMVMIN